MIDSQCPGAKHILKPRPQIYNCPNCGEEVEIWSDENRNICNNCGKTVIKEQSISCIEWCNHAKECVGENAYYKYFANKGQTPPDQGS